MGVPARSQRMNTVADFLSIRASGLYLPPVARVDEDPQEVVEVLAAQDVGTFFVGDKSLHPHLAGLVVGGVFRLLLRPLVGVAFHCGDREGAFGLSFVACVGGDVSKAAASTNRVLISSAPVFFHPQLLRVQG